MHDDSTGYQERVVSGTISGFQSEIAIVGRIFIAYLRLLFRFAEQNGNDSRDFIAISRIKMFVESKYRKSGSRRGHCKIRHMMIVTINYLSAISSVESCLCAGILLERMKLTYVSIASR